MIIWIGIIRNILYFSTKIPFNLVYILLLLGFKSTAVLWIIVMDILVIALIFKPHETIHKLKTFYHSIKNSILTVYLLYLVIYSAKNVVSFEPFFYENRYITSRMPFLTVLIISLYLTYKNVSFSNIFDAFVETKQSLFSLLGIKSRDEIKKQKEREKSYRLERLAAERRKIEALNNITIEQLSTRKEFEFEFFYGKYAPNTLLTVKRELNKNNKERIVGAAMFINAELLEYNKNKIKNKHVNRSGESLRSANVPGYDFLAKKFNHIKNGKKIFIWHRTHLIPFRHTLSEGDTIDNLVFAGTAHLNSGNRPDIGYDLWSRSKEIDGRPQRKKDLRQNFTLNEPIKLPDSGIYNLIKEDESIFEKYYKFNMIHDITVPGAPKDSYYSLADVEEVVDEIILDHPDSDFAYGTILEYENDFLLSPRWCTAILIDKTLNKIVFNIKLSNVK